MGCESKRKKRILQKTERMCLLKYFILEFCFPRFSMLPETKLRETFRFEELLYSKTNGSNQWKANNHLIDK